MGAVTPPYIPRFGAGAPAGLAPTGTIYYDVSNGFAPYIFEGGLWNATANVILGVGAPALLAPAGFLYSRTDAAALYSSQPAPAAAAVVQSAHADNGGSLPGVVTFGAPVTTGNLLLAFLGNSGGGPVSAAWTLLDGGGGGIDGLSAYRYAASSDGATPPAVIASGSSNWGCSMVEISGLSGNPAVDIISHTILGFNGANNTPNQNSTGADQLCILGLTAYDSTAQFALPAGQTNIESWQDATYGAGRVCSATSAGAAQNMGNTAVTTPAGTVGNGHAMQILLKAGLAANWLELAHNP